MQTECTPIETTECGTQTEWASQPDLNSVETMSHLDLKEVEVCDVTCFMTVN